jgi:hypothetical protein
VIHLTGYRTFLQHNDDADNVRAELENLRTYMLHRCEKPDRKRRVVETTFPNSIVAIDLLDISDLHRFNSFYKWKLLLVDTFSRFLWAYKLKK